MNHRQNTLMGIGISVGIAALAIVFFGYFGHGRWLAGNDFWPMHHGYYGPGGMMGFGRVGIFSILPWGLLIIVAAVVIAWLLGTSRHRDVSNMAKQPDALEILKRRYARGEIDREQYLHQRDTLMGSEDSR